VSRLFPHSGRFVALLALVCQLALGAAVPQPALLRLGLAPLCHSDASGHAPGRPRLPPPRMMTPVGLALALAAPPPAALPVLPTPRRLIRSIVHPVTRGVPVPTLRRRTRRARAPPVLI
jgi:hypothetical protein